MWCASCYTTHSLDNFHIAEPQDSSGFVRVKKGDEKRYREAREGDHFMSTFRCDFCIFYMLKKRFPDKHIIKDSQLLCAIRRVTLDAFWANDTQTVYKNKLEIKKIVKLAESVGINPPFAPLGPFEMKKDIMGVGIAVIMVLRSLDPGRYKNYCQFDTLRKLRSAFSNAYMVSAENSDIATSSGRIGGKAFYTKCPTQSFWFQKFNLGCLKRMGQVVKQDLAITVEVLMHMLEVIKSDIQKVEGWNKSMLIMAGAYSCICFCGSFRGHEVFLVELDGLLKYNQPIKESGKFEYIMVPLLGRFKGETGERYHLTPLAAVTKSGIQVKFWIKLLMAMHVNMGRDRGYAFCNKRGDCMASKEMQHIILYYLQKVKDERPDLIPDEVDVYEAYGISRSFRRGATTHATNQRVNQRDIDAANRWRNVENAHGRRISQPMRDHYSEVTQMVPTLLHFSQAL